MKEKIIVRIILEGAALLVMTACDPITSPGLGL